MSINLSIIKKIFIITGILYLNFISAQVEDGFTSWTARSSYGNYIQNTTSGVWSMINGRVYKGSTNGLPYQGFVELVAVSSNYPDGGMLVTPIIADGGAKSIEVAALIRNTSTFVGKIDVQKSVDGTNWTLLTTLTLNTNVSTNNVIPVDDYRDNLRFRIVSVSKQNSTLIDVVKVNHSFVLSSDNSDVCPDTPVILTAESSAPFTYTWTSSAGGNLQQTTGSSVTASPSQAATYTAVGTYTTTFGTVTDTKTINVGMLSLIHI